MPSQVDENPAASPHLWTPGKLESDQCLSTWSDHAARIPFVHERALDPIEFATRRLDFHPDPLQSRILASTAKQILLLMGRQCGKSTIAALKALHLAITRPGSQILSAGRVIRQSSEFLLKVRTFLTTLQLRWRSDGVNPNSIVLPNGSRFVPIPGAMQNVRSFSSIHLLVIDEAAYVPDDLYYTLRPMLAITDGTVILLSTPNGRCGFFHDEWTSGSPAWERFSQASTECPRISPEFLQREKSSQPSHWFRQEYLCEFVDPRGSLFSLDKLRACLTDSFQPRDL